MALAFWTWLWGPMGGFLSSPILIVSLMIKVHLMPDDSPQLPGLNSFARDFRYAGVSPETSRPGKPSQ